MKFIPARTAADVLEIMKSYRDDLREKTLYELSWSVLERLISRDRGPLGKRKISYAKTNFMTDGFVRKADSKIIGGSI
ncbi:hypothetical protein HV097_24240 (plasmid) [Enterobacter roggenkampii]|uniref:hypothetical protein n=1 Tax=Enterobacter cloacae complex TaxID=354276 RepID=UPI0015EA7F8B|nr:MULTISPECIES: hypothetical protein [Enterobacter cloacae complex]QMR83871.1 hypothetical protein HV097_24240 [Enterobacter roggenkampii]UOY39715.1 hypothetical protein LCD50_23385 [Enterobacter kobei]